MKRVTIQSVKFGQDQIQVAFVDADADPTAPPHAINMQRNAVRKQVNHLEQAVASLLGAVVGVPPSEAAGLPPRPFEVLEHIVAGETVTEISEKLFMSESTVKTHVARIYEVLGVHNRAGAVMEAVNRGIIKTGADE